jgi:hypothetical protein
MTARVRSRCTTAALVLAAAALALATGGCGVYVGAQGPDPATTQLRCEQPADDPSGMLVLLAQSVLTAPSVPCLRTATSNWIMTRFDVKDGGAVIEFSNRFGDEETVTIEFHATCDVSGAQEVSSQHAGMQRYNRPVTRAGVYADEVYYVAPGACTHLRFHLTGDHPDLRGAEVAGALGFISRETLDQQIREASDGHLHLDPDEG